MERLRTSSIETFVDYWEGLPLFASQQGMDDATRALLRQVRLSCDPAVLARCIQGSGQHAMPSLTDAVRRLRMPILYAAGMADEKYTKVAVKLAARGCAVCTLMPCGHNVHLERPAMLCGHVRPFLALCDAARMLCCGRARIRRETGPGALRTGEMTIGVPMGEAKTFPWKPGKAYQEIVYETYDGIAKITINRPERRNAFTPLTVNEMYDAFTVARDDAEVGVIILTGMPTMAVAMRTRRSARAATRRFAATAATWAPTTSRA